jgi:DNA-nicking Smr family endonuclease
VRRLSAEEKALWRKVVDSVRPLDGVAAPREPDQVPTPAPKPAPAGKAPAKAAAAPPSRTVPGTTLDGTWDRRLSRGLLAPDRVLDLHGHNLATAYALLDDRLGEAIGSGARLMLLITGKAPEQRGTKRGAIRAAVGDWLGASRHAGDIAAVRNAHPRHGGAGALYIILRRRK